MKAFIRTISLLTFAALISACGSPKHVVMPRTPSTGGSDMEMTLAQEPWKTRPANELAPGFTIQLSSGVDSKINGSFRIDQEGMLKLPYGGKVDTTGMDAAALTPRVNSAIGQFVKSPNVRVEVAKREYFVDVQGLVKKPGQYLVKKSATLDELISAAGGLETGPGAPEYVRVDQLGVSNMVKLKDYYAGKKNLFPEWQGGEIVFFQAERGDVSSGTGRNYVQLLGQFKNPGEYSYEAGNDLYDYMIRAGGPTDRADLYNIDLVRLSGTNREIINFELQNYREIPGLRAGDTVILHADNPSRLEKSSRVIGGWTSIITAIGTMVLLGAKL